MALYVDKMSKTKRFDREPELSLLPLCFDDTLHRICYVMFHIIMMHTRTLKVIRLYLERDRSP